MDFRLFYLSACLCVVGCQSPGFRQLPPVDPLKPVSISLVPEVGQKEVTQYHSRAKHRIYKDGRLQKKQDDVLDFKIRSEVMAVDALNDRISLELKTVSKEGEGDLHEFAFPELGETLKLVVNSRTEVFLAGDHPKDSIFYVPSIPLPKDKVQIGDTWGMKSHWKTKSQSFPLKIEVAGILKALRPCDGNTCALVELSGDVALDAVESTGLSLQSEIQGFLLFSLNRGQVIWSHIRSLQTFQLNQIKNVMESCMVSYVISPEVQGLRDKVEPFCVAGQEFSMEQVPL